MKTTIQVQSAKSAVKFVSSVIRKKVNLPVLAMIHCYANGTFKMRATDLDMTATAICPALSSIDGTRLIPASALRDAMNGKGEFEIESADNNAITFRTGGNVRKVESLSIDEFPVLPETPTSARSMSFPADKFIAALKSIAGAMSTNESRYVLNGVCVDWTADGVKLVATDGSRLHVALLPEAANDPATLAKFEAAQAGRLQAQASWDTAIQILADAEKSSPPAYAKDEVASGSLGYPLYKLIAGPEVIAAQKAEQTAKKAAQVADETLQALKSGVQVLLPAKAVKAVLSMPLAKKSPGQLVLSAWTAGTEKALFANITLGDYSLTTKQIEGNYPNYKQVIPAEHLRAVELPIAEFSAAIKQAATACTEKSNSVKLTLTKHVLTVTGKSENSESSATVACNYNEPDMCIAINPEYLLGACDSASVHGETIRLELIDELSPAVFRNGAIWQAVVMPMRLS